MKKNRHLSYKNLFLREEDINFNPHSLLNDMSISFYFELLQDTILRSNKDFCLLDPAMVSTIYFDDSIEDLSEMLQPLGLQTKKLIFIPLNDCNDRYKQGGGSHWALLLCSPKTKEFLYLDSTLGYIENVNSIALKVSKILGSKTIQKTSVVIPKRFERLQFNSYDCGLYVCLFTQEIIKLFLDGQGGSLADVDYATLFRDFTEEYLRNERCRILKVIDELIG